MTNRIPPHISPTAAAKLSKLSRPILSMPHEESLALTHAIRELRVRPQRPIKAKAVKAAKPTKPKKLKEPVANAT